MTTTMERAGNEEIAIENGRVVSIAGPVVDVEFPRTPCRRSTRRSRSIWSSRVAPS